MEIHLFQSCGHCWVFQILWHIECTSFRILNRSTGIPSPPLALFTLMLPKAHLSSYSSILALVGWSHYHCYLEYEDLFLHSSSVYSFRLFLISFASVSSISFLSFLMPIVPWNVPLISLIILKRSLVFPILLLSSFFALITEEGFLVSPCYSLELCIQMNISSKEKYTFPFTSLLFMSICKASSGNHFAFLHLFFLGMV